MSDANIRKLEALLEKVSRRRTRVSSDESITIAPPPDRYSPHIDDSRGSGVFHPPPPKGGMRAPRAPRIDSIPTAEVPLPVQAHYQGASSRSLSSPSMPPAPTRKTQDEPLTPRRSSDPANRSGMHYNPQGMPPQMGSGTWVNPLGSKHPETKTLAFADVIRDTLALRPRS